MAPETETQSAAVKGLKGVIAADSEICRVDGAQGHLIYRGYNIDELAQKSSFEEVTYLLFYGELPKKSELEDFNAQLIQHRVVPDEVLSLLSSIPAHVHPMAALRTAISYLGNLDSEAEEHGIKEFGHLSLKLITQIGTIVAAIKRIREGKSPVKPHAGLSYAGNFLYMLNGVEPTEDETESMDMILILHAEHGLNASTFAGRVIAATLTDLYSTVVGAIGALKGPLHGGANTAVLNTLREIKTIENVKPYVEKVRAEKGKFMGFGHAVYKVEDPRAKHLKSLAQRLASQSEDPIKWYDISVEMEKEVIAAINRHCNVDFYSASLQHYMGIPGDMFTCIFAVSRMVGWCAHAIEQITENKIIRPQSNYNGHDERSYVPLEQRG